MLADNSTDRDNQCFMVMSSQKYLHILLFLLDVMKYIDTIHLKSNLNKH